VSSSFRDTVADAPSLDCIVSLSRNDSMLRTPLLRGRALACKSPAREMARHGAAREHTLPATKALRRASHRQGEAAPTIGNRVGTAQRVQQQRRQRF
jgi:hypothetical protein